MKIIFITTLLIRLICLYLFRNVSNYDLQSYLQVGELTLKGINIYPDVANLHHPYLPFFLYVEALAYHIGQMRLMRQMGSILIIKTILSIFDLGVTYLIYLLSKKNLKTTFLYAVNPVTILITTLQGQFDVIPVFFILLAIYLLNKKQKLPSVLSFSLAVLTKTWPVLFAIPIARKIKNKKLIILIIFFPVLSVLIYCWLFKSTLIDISKTLIYYQGLWGVWGPMSLISLIRPIGPMGQKLTTLTFLTCFFSYSWFNKEKNLIKNILELLFFFFVFTTNFSIQYFVWIIPFLILIKPEKYFHLIMLITFYLFSFYYAWVFSLITPPWLTIIQNITGFVLWLSFIKIGYLSRKIS